MPYSFSYVPGGESNPVPMPLVVLAKRGGRAAILVISDACDGSETLMPRRSSAVKSASPLQPHIESPTVHVRDSNPCLPISWGALPLS